MEINNNNNSINNNNRVIEVTEEDSVSVETHNVTQFATTNITSHTSSTSTSTTKTIIDLTVSPDLFGNSSKYFSNQGTGNYTPVNQSTGNTIINNSQYGINRHKEYISSQPLKRQLVTPPSNSDINFNQVIPDIEEKDLTSRAAVIHYKGSFLNGLHHGQGTLIIRNEKVKVTWQGEFDQGTLLKGTRTLERTNTKRTDCGEFKYFLLDGYGKMTLCGPDHIDKTYIGPFVQGKRHGTFLVESNGSKLFEEFHNDQLVKSDSLAQNPLFVEPIDIRHQTQSVMSTTIGDAYNTSVPSMRSGQALEAYQGSTLNGLRHGEGQVTVRAREKTFTYAGQWEKGALHVGLVIIQKKHQLIFRYEGSLNQLVAEGKGKLTSTDLVYEGEFKNGAFEGEGVWTKKQVVKKGTWKQGSLIEGELIDSTSPLKTITFRGEWLVEPIDGNAYSKLNGHGEHIIVDHKNNASIIFSGLWQKGILVSGTKVVTKENGSTCTYQGELQSGRAHGQGKLTRVENGKTEQWHGQFDQGHIISGTFSDGDSIYTGQFELVENEVVFHGKGSITWVKDMVQEHYEGEFQAGKPHGVGKRTYTDGHIYEGEFVDGLPK